MFNFFSFNPFQRWVNLRSKLLSHCLLPGTAPPFSLQIKSAAKIHNFFSNSTLPDPPPRVFLFFAQSVSEIEREREIVLCVENESVCTRERDEKFYHLRPSPCEPLQQQHLRLRLLQQPRNEAFSSNLHFFMKAKILFRESLEPKNRYPW